ncbi:OmpA family protein [Nocardioides sp. LHG3406-4]|uniref:OmpA family protein n=1 Tax=Nocardioides sp. LHG3406-4 TaxID=2804575 RepID=UPI003CEC7DEC
MSLTAVRRISMVIAACSVGLVTIMGGGASPAGAVTPGIAATPDVQAQTSDWFVDPRSKAERRAEIAVPGRPKEYVGPLAETRAAYRTRAGDLAVPVRLALGNTVEQGQALTLDGNGLFVVNTTTLTPVAEAQLARLAVSLRNAASIRCEGYADYAGKVGHHRDLARERAVRVCDTLASLSAGLRTSTVGYGSGRPAAVGGRSEDRRLNRRVVVQMTATRPIPVPPTVPPAPPIPAVEVPGAPVLDTASGQEGVVHYAFTGPVTDGGSPVTGYEVTWGEHDWAPVVAEQLGAGLGGVLTGVPTGTPFGISLRAVNAAGAGAPSNTLSVTSYGRPTSPRDLHGTVGADTIVHLSFDVPTSDGGRTITGYDVQVDDGEWVDLPATGTSPLAGILSDQPAGAHTYRVRARNDIGASPASDPVAVQVPAPQQPDAPTISGVGYYGAGQAWAVYFTAGASNGAVVTGYEASLDGGPWTAASGVSGSPAMFPCPGMACGWTYSTSVRLRAVTATGASAPSQVHVGNPI